MGETVFITGADRGVGFELTRCFLQNGDRVFAGQFMARWKELDELKNEYPDTLEIIPLDVSDEASIRRAAELTAEKTDRIDLLVQVAGIAGFAPDHEKMMRILRTNAIGPVCMTEHFLPLMKQGRKRLCYVSSEAGSVSVAHRTEDAGYCLSKTALNMAIRMMFNDLQKDGYTFRIYHPGWVKSYMLGDTKSTEGIYEPDESARAAFADFIKDRPCEDVLMMTDVKGEIWPF